MKLINKYISLALLSGAMMSSCSDSFLQKNSLTESSSSTFWQTSNDAMMALAACYDALQSNQLYNSDQYTFGPLYMECISDNGGHFNWSGWIEGYDVAMGIQNPSSWVFSDYCLQVGRHLCTEHPQPLALIFHTTPFYNVFYNPRHQVLGFDIIGLCN